MSFLKSILILTFFSFTLLSPLQAAEIQGYVRSVNYEGHSFSIDLPPLQRVWVFPSTQFPSGSGYEGFKTIQEGNYVLVEGVSQKNGLFTAKKVELASPPKGGQKGINLNQTFTLSINQKIKINGEPLTLKGIEIIDDLCKEGRDCAGNGTISVRILVSNGNSKKDLLLSSFDRRKPVKPIRTEVLGYQIDLIEIGESSAVLVVRK